MENIDIYCATNWFYRPGPCGYDGKPGCRYFEEESTVRFTVKSSRDADAPATSGNVQNLSISIACLRKSVSLMMYPRSSSTLDKYLIFKGTLSRPRTPHSHSIVSGFWKPAWIIDFCVLIITIYRQFYRPKTSAFASAGDGLGLTGVYSSPSIVNYRREPASLNIWIIRRYRSTTTTNAPKQSLASS